MAVANVPAYFGKKIILMTTGCFHIDVETSVTISEWTITVHIWVGCTGHHQ